MVPHIARVLIVNKFGATGEAQIQGQVCKCALTLNFKNGLLKVNVLAKITQRFHVQDMASVTKLNITNVQIRTGGRTVGLIFESEPIRDLWYYSIVTTK